MAGRPPELRRRIGSDIPQLLRTGQRADLRGPAFTWNPGPDTRVTFLGEFTRVDNQYDEGLIARNGRVPLDNIARYYGEPFSRYNGNANFGLLKVEHDLNANITLARCSTPNGAGSTSWRPAPPASTNGTRR